MSHTDTKQILNPKTVWIEGRCYRVNQTSQEMEEQEQDGGNYTHALEEHDGNGEEMTHTDDYAEEGDDDDDFEVTMINDNRYSTRFHVSKHYIGCIIGKKGAVKTRIERDTKTEIKIPRQGQEGDVEIFGPNAGNVKAARRNINIIIIATRMKQRPTHFISLPLNQPDLMKSFDNFKEIVLRECPEIEESLFTKTAKLHLTVGVMCLMDKEERLQASNLLTAAKDEIVMPILKEHLPLSIRMKGLSYMNDDPERMHVLYGLVQEDTAPSGLLQNLADGLFAFFFKQGFMRQDYGREHVKLHVTLLNTAHRDRSDKNKEDDSQSSKFRKREPFNGSGVLEKFADYDFGVATVHSVHLSQMNSEGSDGYYKPTCVIP